MDAIDYIIILSYYYILLTDVDTCDSISNLLAWVRLSLV